MKAAVAARPGTCRSVSVWSSCQSSVVSPVLRVTCVSPHFSTWLKAGRVRDNMLCLLYVLATAAEAVAVETLQSQLEDSSTERSTSTTPAWPKLSLNTFTASPTDWSPHTRAGAGPHTTTRESVEVVTPVGTISEGAGHYHRHMLPYTSDKAHWQHSPANTIPPARPKYRRLIPSGEELEVSIPKIFVDMAFSGSYSRISVPRSRIQ